MVLSSFPSFPFLSGHKEAPCREEHESLPPAPSLLHHNSGDSEALPLIVPQHLFGI